MGAGASAAGMPIEERRELYSELKRKYTQSDLDGLAEEEKQAWLEVVEEQQESDAAVDTVAASEAVAKTAAEAVHPEIEVEEVAKNGAEATSGGAPCSRSESLGTAVPEVTIQKAAEAAAALTGASDGRKSGWDLSGKDDSGVRPQARQTRLSYLIDVERNGDDGYGRGCPGAGAGEQEHECTDAADAGTGKHRNTACSRRSSAELPAWKKTAEEVETPNELCVGDVVRARDKECNGMWFEGVLTQIHDENTFEVELSGDGVGDDEEGGPQRIIVGIDDVVRVMPWFCIEVGDMVECQLEDVMSWVRGTVVNIDLSQALYDVALESDVDDGFAGREDDQEANVSEGSQHEDFLITVPDSRIRKIISGRQAVAKRWKKVYLASCLTGLGRWISNTR